MNNLDNVICKLRLNYLIFLLYLFVLSAFAMDQLNSSSSTLSTLQKIPITISFKHDKIRNNKGKKRCAIYQLTGEQAEELRAISPLINDISELVQKKCNDSIKIPICSLKVEEFQKFSFFINSIYKLEQNKVEVGKNQNAITREIEEGINNLSLSDHLKVLKVSDFLLVPLLEKVLIKNIACNAQKPEQLKMFRKKHLEWKAQYEDIIDHYYLHDRITQAIVHPYRSKLIALLKIFTKNIYASAHIHSVEWSPDNTKIACGYSNNDVLIWDISTASALRCEGHKREIVSLKWSSDGKKVASGSLDKTAYVWNSTSGKIIGIFWGPDAIKSIAWNQDGTKFAYGSSDIRIWSNNNNDEWSLLHRLTGHMGSVYSIAWSPDGTKIASGGFDNIIIWDVATGKPLHILDDHTDSVVSLAWSQGGNKLVSGSRDNTIKIWENGTGRLIKTLTGHTKRVTSISCSPDGSMIVSGSWDDTIRIWDSISGEPIQVFSHKGPINSVAWSPDGTKIASGVWDGTIRIWDINPLLELLNTLKQLDLRQALFIVSVITKSSWTNNNEMLDLFKTLPDPIKVVIKPSVPLALLQAKNSLFGSCFGKASSSNNT